MIGRFLPVLMGRTLGKLRIKTAEMTDERVRNMSEMVSGIRVIKLYAWEELFIDIVHLCRKYKQHRYAFFSLFSICSKIGCLEPEQS